MKIRADTILDEGPPRTGDVVIAIRRTYDKKQFASGEKNTM